MCRLILATLLTVFPVLTAADGHSDALSRLEAGTTAMTDNLLDFYVSRVPELADVRPDMSWDAAFRDAGQCILNGIDADGGSAAVAEYLTALEKFAAADPKPGKFFGHVVTIFHSKVSLEVCNSEACTER